MIEFLLAAQRYSSVILCLREREGVYNTVSEGEGRKVKGGGDALGMGLYKDCKCCCLLKG